MNRLYDNELEMVTGGVTQEEALAIALKYTGFARGQIDYLMHAELDYEHGRRVYEVRFFKGGVEYEVNVDASTGAILKYEKDYG